VKIEDQVVKASVPEGSRFKGHEPFMVQDLVISATATCYHRERWVTPDGRTILAPLPEGIGGHFGPRTAPLRADAVSSGSIDAAAAWQRCCTRWAWRSRSVSCKRLLIDKQDDFVRGSSRRSCALDWNFALCLRR